MKKKISHATVPEYEDVTFQELLKDWMKAASIANRTGKKEDKEKSRIAKRVYFETLKKVGCYK